VSRASTGSHIDSRTVRHPGETAGGKRIEKVLGGSTTIAGQAMTRLRGDRPRRLGVAPMMLGAPLESAVAARPGQSREGNTAAEAKPAFPTVPQRWHTVSEGRRRARPVGESSRTPRTLETFKAEVAGLSSRRCASNCRTPSH
jgi:hypothetical protein